MGQLYDTIGKTYADYRRPDPRIAAAIKNALGDAQSIVNVGAGTGSYEPADRQVVAVEPSPVMIAQRSSSAAPVVRASAISAFANIRAETGLAALRRDLDDGTWQRRNDHLLELNELDLGYRLVIGTR